MKKIVTFILALVLVWNLSAGNVAEAAYTAFPVSFHYSGSGSASTWVTSQVVDVQGNANQYAYAKCTYFSYTGGQPTLAVRGITSGCETYTTQFTGTGTHSMEYYYYIPSIHTTVRFQGNLSYPVDKISASVQCEVQG